jgi:5-methylthioribose kinase
MTPADFRREHPGLFHLDPLDASGAEEALRSAGILAVGERVVGCGRAGEGNMNCTVRVRTNGRSMILKQSRPWVEKYPQFAAPWDRIAREHEFYLRVAGVAGVADHMPAVLHFDARSRWMVLEDLGCSGDYTDLYSGMSLTVDEARELGGFLGTLHRLGPLPGGATLDNRPMRMLNHAHVFEIPFQTGNGLDLDAICPGLEAVVASIRSDAGFRCRVSGLGQEVYLRDGPSLLHGDFFPGSLVRTPSGPRVIDPEFGFYGRPEFDVGVWLAHLLLSSQSAQVLTAWTEAYRPPMGFDPTLACSLAGVEVLRRLLGYAQLPLKCTPMERVRCVHIGLEWVREPSLRILEAGIREVSGTRGSSC